MFNDYATKPVDYYAVENEIPDWLEISVSYDATKGTVFNFKADPLPEGVSGRRADVSFTTVIGGREVFVATQGDALVAGVEATNSKVAVVDGNFVVESDNATSVAVTTSQVRKLRRLHSQARQQFQPPILQKAFMLLNSTITQ